MAKHSSTITIERDPSQSLEKQEAATMLRPDLQAGYALANTHVGQENIGLEHYAFALNDQIKAMKQGSSKRMEDMLLCQAHTLDALFNNLTVKAMGTEYLDRLKVYMNLALKAQSQTRATLAALSDMKNPRQVAYVNQANIAAGNQQVNNHGANNAGGGTEGQNSANSANPAAQKNQKTPNKLMDKKHFQQKCEAVLCSDNATKEYADEQQWLDSRTPQEAIRTDKDVETLETVNRG